MAVVFKTLVEFQKHIEGACNVAVGNACNRLLGKLQEFLDSEYYDAYEPEVYERTMSFWRSATTEMLSKTCGQVFMYPNEMNYKDGWDGISQIESANQGLHGGWAFTGATEHKYWDVFMDYCNNHALEILKEELQKQGVPVK